MEDMFDILVDRAMALRSLARASRVDTSRLPAASDPTILQLARESGRVARSLDGLQARLAGEVARRSDRSLGHDSLAAREGFANAGQLLAELQGVSAGTGAGQARLGEALTAPGMDPVQEAIDTGRISRDQATAITRGLDGVQAPADVITGAVTGLIGTATTGSVQDVETASRFLARELAPEDPAVREARVRARRSLRLGKTQADGTTPLHGTLDPLSAAWVRALFDHYITPRRRVTFTGTGEAATWGSGTVAADRRTADQYRVDVLVGIARDVLGRASGDLAPAARPTIFVTMTARQLRDGFGAAGIIGQDEPISAGTARRLAADADLIPAVLGTRGEILDQGRRHRLYTHAQRLALTLRDQGCTWKGCTAPPGQCEINHITEWQKGGPTDLANAALVCTFHHALLDRGWSMTRANGQVIVTAPRRTA